jgi:hypothetical protein
MWRWRNFVAAAILVVLLPAPVAGAEPTPTTTWFTQSSSSAQVGQEATFWVAISPAPDGGSVELRVDGVGVMSRQLVADAGAAQLFWSPDAPGVFSVQAHFLGTDAFAASESWPISVTVINPPPQSVTIVGVPNPVARNADVTFTATVLPNPGPGSIEWIDASADPSVVATTELEADGTATWTTAFDAAGTEAIAARFTGNGSYSRRTSDFFYLTVSGDAVVVSVVVAESPRPPGPVSADVTITPNPGGGLLDWQLSPGSSGHVTADVDGTTTIDLGTHSSAGTYTLSVHFQGYGNYGAADGQTGFVVAYPTTTTLVSNLATAVQGELPIVLTATVTAAYTISGGTVTFLDDVGGNVVELGPVAVNPSTGSATFSSSSLRVGSHSMVAQYTPAGGTFLGSTSDPVSVEVSADTAVHVTFKPSLAKFHPYKDGYKDKVGLAGLLSERASVTIRVYSSTGSLVRKFDLGWRNAGSFAAWWNGKKSNGVQVPAGTYKVKATFKDSGGHTRTITATVKLNWKRVIWKSVTVTKYGEVGEYFVSEFGGTIYYSPDYPKGRILDSGEMIRDCEACGFAAGRFVFTVKADVLAYRKLYLAGRGHGFIDREHPGSLSLVDPVTLELVLTRPNSMYDEPDHTWGIPFTTAQVSATRKVEAWIWMTQAMGDAYDLNWLKLTYQYAVWA